jgi:hypothetical protein
MSGTVQAVPFTTSFPSSSSTIVTSGGFFFLDSDFVSQTFTGTGLASVDSLDLSLTLRTNVLKNNAVVSFDVFVNSIIVGGITFDQTDPTGVAFPLNFPFFPINGAGTYSILLDETNTVPGGDGSVSFVWDVPNSLTLNGTTSVPEPTTFGLIGLGLLGLGAMRRRRRTAEGVGSGRRPFCYSPRLAALAEAYGGEHRVHIALSLPRRTTGTIASLARVTKMK